MLSDELVHVAGADFAHFDAGLLGHEGLHRLVPLAGDTVEAHQVAEDDVIAITAIDLVVAWQDRFGVTEDGFGQVLRIDVGLWFTQGVVGLEIIE